MLSRCSIAFQKAARAYIAEQSAENRRLLARAVNRLQDLIPWPEAEKVCPAHQRMLDLMPVHLQWPDPIWEELELIRPQLHESK